MRDYKREVAALKKSLQEMGEANGSNIAWANHEMERALKAESELAAWKKPCADLGLRHIFYLPNFAGVELDYARKLAAQLRAVTAELADANARADRIEAETIERCAKECESEYDVDIDRGCAEVHRRCAAAIRALAARKDEK